MTTTSIANKRPALRKSVAVNHVGERAGDGGALAIALLHLGDEILLEGTAARIFSRVHPFMDGNASVEELIAHTGERADRVTALVESLVSAGVVVLRDTHGAPVEMSGEDFHRLHRRLCERWLQPIYAHPLWQKMSNGEATRAHVMGFAFEKYHYIEGAFEHMAIAAANASPWMMPHLARHFIEEYTHGDIYRKGLAKLCPDQVVLHSQPLPSTRALVNFLNESAARDSFAYYAGNELLQMTENTDEPEADQAVESLYDAMKRHYPWSAPLVASFIAHTNADQKLGHRDVFLEMCRSVPPLRPDQVELALSTARSMAEHLLLFMDGIDTFYGRFPSVPRLPCELLSE